MIKSIIQQSCLSSEFLFLVPDCVNESGQGKVVTTFTATATVQYTKYSETENNGELWNSYCTF